MHPHTRNWTMWLRESGELVLAAAAESWLFLWLVDVEKAQAHTRVAWPLGEWLSNHFEIAFDRDTLWVIAHHNLIEISCRDWEIRSCRCFRDFAPEGAIIEESTLMPGSPYLWVRTSLPEDTFLVEIGSWTVHRHVDEGDSLFTPVTGPDPLVCFTEPDEKSVLYRLDGTPLAGELPIDYILYSIARPPDGPGFLTLEVELDVDDEAVIEANDVILKHLAPDESGSWRLVDVLRCRVIDEEGSQIFVSRDHDLCWVRVYVLLDGRDLTRQLLAVSVDREDATLAVRYRVSVPDDLALVQDSEARRVVAVFTDGRGLCVWPAGRERPSFDLPRARFDRGYLTIPELGLRDADRCGRPLGADRRVRSYPLAQEIRKLSPAERAPFVDRYKSEFRDDVEKLTDLYYALDAGEMREDVLRLLREEHAEEPAAALLLADLEAGAGRWSEVPRWLDVARRGEFRDCRLGHVLHLEGLVRVREGRMDEAWEAFSKAHSYEDTSTPQKYEESLCHCFLGDLELLTRPMSDPPEAREWDVGQPLLRQLVGAIRTADHFRAAGDDEAALAALDRPVFWQTGEVQWAARQAEIFLEKSEASGGDLFQERFAIAHFREVYRHCIHRKEIHLPGLTWERERIERIDERARVRLECL